MTTFYICRHGQTENNKNGKLSGWTDTPLTEAGIDNVKTSAAKLAHTTLDGIYSSDLGRAFITAYDIARIHGYSDVITRVPDLRENNYGDISGLAITVAEERYPDLHRNVDFVAPNGESLAQMQSRVIKAITSIAATNDERTVLIAVHDGVIKAIFAKFQDIDLATLNQEHDFANDFVGSFTITQGVIGNFKEVVLPTA